MKAEGLTPSVFQGVWEGWGGMELTEEKKLTAACTCASTGNLPSSSCSLALLRNNMKFHQVLCKRAREGSYSM